MKKKVTKKSVAKKVAPKKVVAKKAVKKPSVKKVENPLNSKAAIADLRKQYATLAKINNQRAAILESISKKEAELSEVLDLNLAKVEDRSNEDLLKKIEKQDDPYSITSRPTTDLRITSVASPFKQATTGVLAGLNAVACRY